MKIQNQILALGASGAIFVIAVGLAGIFSARYIESELHSALHSSAALSESQSIGTLLDSVRGDVQLALFAGRQRNPFQIDEAETGFKAHVKVYQEKLSQLTADTRSAHTETIVQLSDDYLKQASEIVAFATSDVAHAEL